MSNPERTPRRPNSTTGGGTQGDEKWIESLAALLLRLLGVYFTASAVISIFTEAGRLMFVWRYFTLTRNETLMWQSTVSLARLTVAFLIGMYLVLGGQWVFDRILTPVVCRRADGSVTSMNEDSVGSCQGSAEAQEADTE